MMSKVKKYALICLGIFTALALLRLLVVLLTLYKANPEMCDAQKRVIPTEEFAKLAAEKSYKETKADGRYFNCCVVRRVKGEGVYVYWTHEYSLKEINEIIYYHRKYQHEDYTPAHKYAYDSKMYNFCGLEVDTKYDQPYSSPYTWLDYPGVIYTEKNKPNLDSLSAYSEPPPTVHPSFIKDYIEWPKFSR